MISWALAFVGFFLGLSAQVHAAGGKCMKELAKTADEKSQTGRYHYRIIESPRAVPEAQIYNKYVQELVRPGGVLEQLGLELPPQVMEFVPPLDLQAIVSGSAGGYPVRHYLDGANVLRSMKPTGGFALEVIYPGGGKNGQVGYQHGLFRDDNIRDQQYSIVDHAFIGHSHFAKNSGLPHYRVGQGLEATRELDAVLEKAYREFDQDYVMRWYLFAQTLKPLLDYSGPYWEPVEDFVPKSGTTSWMSSGGGQVARPEIMSHPRKITENVLQAITANLGPEEPSWKREILEKLIVSMSFRPALVHTQIMNEGWASIMQEIIPRHTENHHTLEYYLNSQRVMQGETWPKVRDPYSLGVFCWRRIRERFEEQPEIKSLKSQLEKDGKFLRYGEKLIATMTDDDFIRFAVDQRFIDKTKLAVVRRASREENDPNLPPPPSPKNPGESPPAQWIIVSRESERVAQMLIDTVLKPKYIYRPRVRLMNFTRPNTGEVELVIDDDFGRVLPIDHETVGPALYALANIMNRPMSLEATFMEKKGQQPPDWIWHMPDWWRREYGHLYMKPTVLMRARVIVSPYGDVSAYKIVNETYPGGVLDTGTVRKRSFTEEAAPELAEKLSSYLKAYIVDLYLEDDKQLERVVRGSETLREAISMGIKKISDDPIPEGSLVLQSPNAAGAISTYEMMLNRRMAMAMERASKLKGGFVIGSGGKVKLRALPSEVHIEFDREYLEQTLKDLPPAPIGKAASDLHMTLSKSDSNSDGLIASPFNPDAGGNGQVGPIDGHKGDRFWGPGDSKGGKGGNKPGEEESDPSWVDIPEELYSRFLGERVRLPKLNKKPGLSKTSARKPGRSRRSLAGFLREDRIMENAVGRGVEALIREGKDPFENPEDMIYEGFEGLQPSDIIVKSTKPTKKPDVKAVVVFVMDASGSVGAYLDAFKRFVNDMEALVRYNYKGFDFRFIVFDHAAHLLKNRDEFFKFQLGGGTDYSAGISRAKKLFEDDYPRAAWDRYTFVLGDMEDFGTQAMSPIKSLLEESEYFGGVAGLHREGYIPELFEAIVAEAGSNDAVGHTVIDKDGGYVIRNLREVLRNEEESN